MSYDGKNNVLTSVSLDIENGEFVIINGNSGSGKTTLLNIIGMIQKNTSGDIFLDGKNYLSFSQNEICNILNKRISFIFQNFLLEPEFTVFENVEIPFLISKAKYKNYSCIIDDVLKKLDIYKFRNKKVKFLSGGEQQRACIARSIALDSDIILADEATGSLDSKNGIQVLEMIKDMNLRGKTILFVTHNPELIKYGNHIITLMDGRVIKNEYF